VLLKFRGAGGSFPPLPRPVIEPVYWRNTYQGGALDLPVNVALLAITAALAGNVIRAPLYVTAPTRAATLQIEHAPNVAVQAQAPQAQLRPTLDPVSWKTPTPQLDLSPNLAVQSVGAVTVPPAPVDPAFAIRWAQQADVYPNIAVNLQTQSVRAFVEPVLWKALPQFDQFPNVAIRVVGTVYVPPPPVEPWIATKAWVQPETYRNIAVTLQTQITRPGVDPPQVPRPWAAVDLYPNLALQAPIAQVPLSGGIEPWIAKRYPPQVEVFQNKAIYAPAESPSVPPAVIEPVRTLQPATQVELYPNLAVLPPSAPPPVVEVPDSHEPGLEKGLRGKGWKKKRHDDLAQTQVIRESQLPGKKPKTVAVSPMPAAPVMDAPDEEFLLALLQQEDDETAEQLAAHAITLLKTLH
jgi:hypothetical protein